ncbi:TPA: hypothetical protein ACVOYJ_004765 [Vibrio diabolicus]
MTEIVDAYLPYAIAMALTIIFMWSIWSLLFDIGMALRCAEFKKSLLTSLSNGDVSWNDVRHLQASSSITTEQCLSVLNSIKTDIIKSGDKNKIRVQIEAYISQLTTEEPFEGIPDKLRIHLIAVKDQLAKTESFGLLVEELRVLVRTNSREHKILKWCTIGGFLFGLVSLLLPLFGS